MNTILSLETEYLKVVKELKLTDFEDRSTCDNILREFILMMVDAGWQPGSIKESVIALADEYTDYNPDII